MPQLIIADSTLRNFMGHSFEYAHSLAVAARAQGVNVVVLGHESIIPEVQQELHAVPCFRHGIDDDLAPRFLNSRFLSGLRDRVNYRLHCRSMRAALNSLAGRIEFSRDTTVFFHTLRHNQILPIVRWAESLPEPNRPRMVVMLRFTAYPSYEDPSSTEPYYRHALRTLELGPAADRFQLVTDSDLLQDEFSEYTSLKIDVVGIPHGEAQAELQPESKSPLTLGYAGDARRNKGFHLLPGLLGALRAELQSGQLRAEIQSPVRSSSEWDVRNAVESLRRLPVHLIEQPLSGGEYAELLRQIDIMLLPYTLEHYHSQSSGIFCEALSRGIPVVVPRGTWMADQITKTGGGVTFLPEDACSLEAAVRALIANYPEVKSKALAGRSEWNSQHNAAAVLRSIMPGWGA